MLYDHLDLDKKMKLVVAAGKFGKKQKETGL